MAWRRIRDIDSFKLGSAYAIGKLIREALDKMEKEQMEEEGKNTQEPLATCKIPSPLAGWVGGKYRLAKKLIPLFPGHRCYCEPFCGAAWLLFRKNPATSKVEVINDINGEVINLYHICRDRPESLDKYFTWAIHSRQEFNKLKNQNPDDLDEVQRAWSFLYLVKYGFSGSVVAPRMGYTTKEDKRARTMGNLAAILPEIRDRLRKVTLECLPWAEVVARYDGPETFFYLDPPYFGCEDWYGKGLFSRDDFSQLALVLRSLKGKFLLSINDCEDARELFGPFNMRRLKTKYSICNSRTTDACELVFANYPLPEGEFI